MLPITSRVIEFNGETSYNICNAVNYNKSVIRKWVTVAGDIENKYVVNVPIGMRVSDLLARLNIRVPESYSVLDGGPSMGKICDHSRAVVTKTTKSLLILPDHIPAIAHKKISLDDMMRRAASACCGCSRCTDMCPRHLLGYPLEPHKMIRTALSGVVEDIPEIVKNATLCCSCGVCAEVCCQDISPKDIITHLKGILAKNKMKYTAGNENYEPSSDRRYRMISSTRWEDMLGVRKYDAVPTFINERLMSKRVEIPMSGHIGAPSIPTVSIGDTVKEYDPIAKAADGLSLPQYASIEGKVTFVNNEKVIIEA
jgi:Na+-translocating ferredoxin:NAD+ oxidoreductase RnfC subunit